MGESSDEDQRSVEVVFDPSNPYRRKSSLVTNDTIKPRLRRHSHRTQCLVHQFLENQQRVRATDHDENHDEGHDEGHGESHDEDDRDGNESRRHPQRHGKDVPNRQGSKRLVEPKGTTKNGFSVLDNPSDTSDVGQVDEKHWKVGIVQPSIDSETTGADVMHSRLLTKKQLSDMAWGVRELSRRLGSMRLKFKVKSIFVLAKIQDPDLLLKVRQLTKWLLSRERGSRYTVYVQREIKENRRFDATGLLEELQKDYAEAGEMSEEVSKDITSRLRPWDEHMCRTRPHTFDFVITLGGDGTVLYASWLFQRIVPPVLSFSLGSLGFLTKFDFEDYQKTLNSAFTDGVTVSLRLRFEATIMRSQRKKSNLVTDSASGTNEEDEELLHRKRDLVEELVGEEKDDEHTHRPDGTYEILNEVVVDRGPSPTLSFTEIFGDDEHFTSVLADGLCVSTPTGSTAYNLAAGGSLCHPENPVMLVTSICAHTLSFRPIILPDTIVLRIGVPYDARTSSWASFDGRERMELSPGDYVTISASRYPFASVLSPGKRSEDWVNSIRSKLNWNTRQKQKAFKEWER